MKRYALLVFAMPLSGCGAFGYVACPTIVTYSKADQAALAAELRANTQPHPQTTRQLQDYVGQRDQVRACMK